MEKRKKITTKYKGYKIVQSAKGFEQENGYPITIYKNGKNVGNFAFEYDAKNSIDRKLKL
tara:strand:- start:1064 stop:1243 length:180 start_codon:yes stop_codon:yes gene_type:complete